MLEPQFLVEPVEDLIFKKGVDCCQLLVVDTEGKLTILWSLKLSGS